MLLHYTTGNRVSLGGRIAIFQLKQPFDETLAKRVTDVKVISQTNQTGWDGSVLAPAMLEKRDVNGRAHCTSAQIIHRSCKRLNSDGNRQIGKSGLSNLTCHIIDDE